MVFPLGIFDHDPGDDRSVRAAGAGQGHRTPVDLPGSEPRMSSPTVETHHETHHETAGGSQSPNGSVEMMIFGMSNPI